MTLLIFTVTLIKIVLQQVISSDRKKLSDLSNKKSMMIDDTLKFLWQGHYLIKMLLVEQGIKQMMILTKACSMYLLDTTL